MNSNEHAEIEAWARKIIPAHLNADVLIANSWNNCADVSPTEVLSCFVNTVKDYIDQDCITY